MVNILLSSSQSIGHLKQLMFLDASKNQLREVPGEVEGCVNLADLHLTSNSLLSLPDSLGGTIIEYLQILSNIVLSTS